MIFNKKVVVVLPAYNAEKTLKSTVEDICTDIVDAIVLVDDGSTDKTVEIAKELGLHTYLHGKNLGYGSNIKTCYTEALKLRADIVIVLHPDYQYDPKLIGAMGHMIASGIYDIVLGSRMLGNTAHAGGMPFYKYIANRILTFFQNLCLNHNVSEYHTGYRAYTRHALETINWHENSNDFLFDNQVLAQCHFANLKIGEISCPTKYFEDSSSIKFLKSMKYGFGVLKTGLLYRLNKWHVVKSNLFCTPHTQIKNNIL